VPHKQGTTSIASGTINVNILSGWQYEYLPWPARLKLIMNAEAPTTAGAFQLATVFSGSETIMEESGVQSGATAGVIPNELNVPPIVWDAPAGDRVKVQVRNPDSAAKNVNFVIYAYPLS
jgi:hypothetical protein